MTIFVKSNNLRSVPQAREAGSVGGRMVKNICPIRTVKYDRHIRTTLGHMQTVEYMIALVT